MAKKRAVKNSELKKKQPKSLNIEEIKYLLENIQNTSLEEMAEKLDCTEQQVQEVVDQYNKAGQNLAKSAFIIGKENKKGLIVMTEASSGMGDRVNPMLGGQNTVGSIKPKPVDQYIHRMGDGS
jgi:site-specific recombinase XerD